MNKLTDILDWIAQIKFGMPYEYLEQELKDGIDTDATALNKYISENYIPKSNFDKALAIAEHTGYEHAVKDYKEVEQRKRAGITVDGEKPE